MQFVLWIAIGLVSGWLAGMLLVGNGYGVIGDILFGIAGSVGGGLLTAIFVGGNGSSGGYNLISVVFALVGAVIFIAIVRFLPRRRLA